MKSPRVFVHIGASKTGTSTLQQEVFPKHEEIDFRFWPKRDEIPDFFKCLYSDVIYDDEKVFERCSEELDARHCGSTGVVLYSREHLTHQRYDKGVIARRLRRLFGDAGIILTIRNQFDWIESSHIWDQRLLRQPWQGGLPPSFEGYLAGQWQERHRSRLSSGDFGAIARFYISLFGRERVTVLPFEELVGKPDLFAQRLFGFLDVSVERGLELMAAKHRNPRLTARRYNLWYWRAVTLPMALQRIMYGRISFGPADRLLDRGPAKRVNLSEPWREDLASFFKPGNRYLAEEFGLPLEDYGYPV